MITVINSTNRPGNLSQIFSKEIINQLTKLNQEVNYYSLEELPENFAFGELYGRRSPEFEKIILNKISPAEKLVFVVPEYNGSYAGILKMFLEAIHPKIWNHKKALVVGVAGGRAGNLIGIDQLVTVLNYLQITTMPQRLIISRIEDLINNNQISDKTTLEIIENHVRLFVDF